jgi:hypothetical protein
MISMRGTEGVSGRKNSSEIGHRVNTRHRRLRGSSSGSGSHEVEPEAGADREPGRSQSLRPWEAIP